MIDKQTQAITGLETSKDKVEAIVPDHGEVGRATERGREGESRFQESRAGERVRGSAAVILKKWPLAANTTRTVTVPPITAA